MSRSRPATVLSLALAAVLPAACAESDADDDASSDVSGGKADDIAPEDFACKQVSGISLEALAQIDDPIADLLIKRGEGCPADYAAIVERLRELDPEGCTPGKDLVTRIVSDDARIDPNPDNYRTVTTRACGSRPQHSLMWTLLSVRANEDIGKRTFIEMQALDRASGLYDFWVFGDGRFTFQGNSLQAAAGTISCGNCHRDGGVLMKELDDPWIHWESDGQPLPGVDALFAAHAPMFGVRGNGKELEAIVRTGNDAIVGARLGVQGDAKTGNVATLLRPLFCAEQVNLDTAGREVDGPVTQLPADLLLDPRWELGDGVAIDPAAYEAAVAAAGQVVPGVTGRTDTEFKLVFPERAGFDDAYLQALVAQGIVDEDFLLDVLAVDFTRPLFSDARCGLLAFAPVYGEAGSGTSGGDEGGSDDGSSSSGDGGSTGDDTTGGDDGAVDVGDCCMAGTAKGCSNDTIEACVCAKDDFCCNSTWDATCVSEVGTFGCATCPAAPPPDMPPAASGTTIAEAEPKAIREAFIAALQQSAPAAGTPAAQLLANLMDTSDSAAHRDRVKSFVAACDARDDRELADDVLRVVQLTRTLMKQKTSLIEHAEQLAQTNLQVASSAHLDPATCTLVD